MRVCESREMRTEIPRRIIAASIEALHDEKGIVWPLAIAPYKVLVTPVNAKDSKQFEKAEQVFDSIAKLFPNDVVLDDRDERIGFKLTEAELIGFPVVIVCGDAAKNAAGNSSASDLIEVHWRNSNTKEFLSFADIQRKLAELK